VCTFLAGVNHGVTRLLWSLLAVAGTSSTAVLAAVKEKQTRAATATAVAAKTALAITLNRAGQPLVRSLTDVASARSFEERQTAVWALLARTVGIAAAQCGHDTQEKCATRSVFYQFVDDNHLKRVVFEGRQGDPRPCFCGDRSDNDRAALDLAKGEAAAHVPDVDQAPPPFDPRGRRYKTFIGAPVRAGGRSYGILFVDSDKAQTLTEVDTGYVILLAGVLATALSLVDGRLPALSDHVEAEGCEHLSHHSSKNGESIPAEVVDVIEKAEE
jgi:GAF domain-containing protein